MSLVKETTSCFNGGIL